MATKLSTSGEWLLPYADIPSAGPVDSNGKGRSGSPSEGQFCYECSKSYRNCECKCCLKCGSPFLKYFGTNLIKGRSHCRICFSPICSTCIILIKGMQKVCTRCHLKQKEDEISTEKALSAIAEAKFGSDPGNSSSLTKLKTSEQKKEALFDAAKKGHDHILVTLINMGVAVDITDAEQNTPLFYAAEGGFFTSVVLLLEKGANVRAVNSNGWTPLHAVAWKGSTDPHIDCVEHLLEMGADIFKETDQGETAADLATRCGGVKEMIQILRAAEVEISLEVLEEKANTLIETAVTAKEKRFGKMVLQVLKYFQNVDSAKPSQSTPPGKKLEVKKLILPSQTLMKSASLNSNPTTRCNMCNLCKSCSGWKPIHKSKGIPMLAPSNVIDRPRADVEPIVRSLSAVTTNSQNVNLHLLEAKKNELEKEVEKLKQEKEEWEERSRKLMVSIATSSKEHEKQMEELKSDVERLKEEKTIDISKVEASHANKLAKIKMENDLILAEKDKQIAEREQAYLDLFHLQKNYKMTWIPDDLVKECQQGKCRRKFAKTVRKHHCRLCGRIYCNTCSHNKTSLAMLSYNKPVRVCNTCFALMDDLLTESAETS